MRIVRLQWFGCSLAIPESCGEYVHLLFRKGWGRHRGSLVGSVWGGPFIRRNKKEASDEQ